MPFQALPSGRVTTLVALSIGRKTTPKADRVKLMTELPRRSIVIRITEVSDSRRIARRRVKDKSATGLVLQLVESWEGHHSAHRFDIFKCTT